MSGIKFFLSAVTAEFGDEREHVRHMLTRPRVEAKIQEDFVSVGLPTLLMLDEYIAACDCVIHIIGDRPGSNPPMSSVETLVQTYPDLHIRVPELASLLNGGDPDLSYTQWEAYLALYHGKRLILLRPAAAPHDHLDSDGRVPDTHDKARQKAHLTRLIERDLHPTVFAGRDQLVTGVALQALDIYLRAGLAPPSTTQALRVVRSIAPPTVPHYTERPALEQQLLALLGKCAAEGSGVVSLGGIGGSGKTTLAAHVVARDSVIDAFPAGIIWLTIGRDRTDERLSSYICEVVQGLTGSHFAATDLSLSAAALIDCLYACAEPVLLVLDDVWTDDQIVHLLRGGANVTRLVLARNKLGALENGFALEVPAMSRDEAIGTLLHDLPTNALAALTKGHVDALIRFSRHWPVLLTVLNAALRENLASGATPVDAATWLIGLITRSGPAALDGTLAISLEKSIEVTLNATLDLIDPNSRALYASLRVFADDVVIPDHVIFMYWRHRNGISQADAARVLGKLTHLRLLTIRWSQNDRGYVLHDVIRDFLVHRLNDEGLSGMSRDLVASWRAALLPAGARSEWWRLPSSASFVFEHLSSQLAQAGLHDERRALLHNLRWYVSQITCLGSPASALADLQDLTDPASVELSSFLSSNAMLLRREPAEGGLASTLLAYATDEGSLLRRLARELANSSEWPTLRSHWTVRSPALHEIQGHFGPIGDVALSPDGSLVATASDDGMALILDAKDGGVRLRLRGHSERVRSCTFSPAGSLLLTSGMDGTARVWNAVTGDRVTVLRREGVALLGSGWSPTGNLIAGSFIDGTTFIWNAQDGTVVTELSTEHGGGTWDCAFLNDYELVTVGDDGYVRCWRLHNQQCSMDVFAHSARIRRCDLSPDLRYCATASSDGTAAIVDLLSQKVAGYFRGHSDRLRSVQFSPDGHLLVTASEDRAVQIWDTTHRRSMYTMNVHTDWVGKAVFESSGRSVISCSGDATVRRWSYAISDDGTPRVTRLLGRDGDDTSSCCFSGDGETVLYGKVNVVRAVTLKGRVVGEFEGHRGRVLDVVVDHDVLFSAGADGAIIARQLSDGAIRAECQIGSRVWSLGAPDNCGVIVSAAEDGYIRIHLRHDLTVLRQSRKQEGHLMACATAVRQDHVWFVGDGSKVGSLSLSGSSQDGEMPLTGYRSLWACAYSHNGHLLAVAGEPGTQALLIDLSGGPQRALKTGVGRITSVAFSCDDRLIATCGDDGYVAIWQTDTGTHLTGLRTPFPLRRCAWSPRHPRLLAAAGTGGEYLLEVDDYGQHQ
jgi:WD40 repeat protein